MSSETLSFRNHDNILTFLTILNIKTLIFRNTFKIKFLYWHLLISWKTFNIHRSFTFHKMFFIVEKGSLDSKNGSSMALM